MNEVDFIGILLQKQSRHYFSASRCEWELELLETSHFAVAASGLKVQVWVLSKVNIDAACVCVCVCPSCGESALAS